MKPRFEGACRRSSSGVVLFSVDMGWQKRLEHWRRCGPVVAWSSGSLLFCLLDSERRFGVAVRLALICLDGSCSFDGWQ